MSTKKIEHFILPEHFNHLLPYEASTSLNLTRDVADKINEIVDMVNELETINVNEHFNQNAAIRKAVVYMKDNLLNSLNDLMVTLRDSGFIDDRILYHCNNLNERLNNLLGQVKSGTTSMDAEIIDARMDSDTAVWGSLGNLIRAIHEYSQMLMGGSYFITEKVDTPVINGWMNRAGEYRSNASTGETHKCLKFEVSAGDSFLIYSEYGWDMSDAVALDSSNTMVKLFNTAEERKVNDETLIITVPDKARYLVVNCMYPSKKPITARKIVGIDKKAITKYVENVFGSLKGTKPILSDNLITNVKTGTAIRSGEEFTIDNQGFVVGECSVESGKVYQITCGGSFECNPYHWFDKDGVPVDYAPVLPATNYVSNIYTVVCPMNARILKVANYNSATPVVREIKGYGSEAKWKHLKWCCLGDSLTEVNSRTSKHYFDYVSETTGINVVNMGVGGTGYKRGYEENKAFYQRVVNVPADCDVVTIFGSGNDNTYFSTIGNPTDKGTNTLCGCINSTIDSLYSINPLMKIGIVSPTPWVNHTPDTNSKFKDYSKALKEICELRGIPFLDLYHLSGFRPNDETYRNLVFSKDDGNGVHPNEVGHKIISSHFYHFLESLIGTY